MVSPIQMNSLLYVIGVLEGTLMMVLSTTETCCWLSMCPKNTFNQRAFFGFLFIHCFVYSTLIFVLILNHIKALYTLSFYSVENLFYYYHHLTSMPRSTKWSLPFIFFSPIFFINRLRWPRGSVLAFSTQVRGFKPGRNRFIFRAKKSSTRLPSEGK